MIPNNKKESNEERIKKGRIRTSDHMVKMKILELLVEGRRRK